MGGLRLTIGERLGLATKVTIPAPPRFRHGPPESSGVPVEVTPEKVIRLADAPSAKTLMFESIPEHIDDGGPPRVRGEMVWLHKTAPTLVIEGGRGLTPEEHAAGRRR